MPVRSSADFRGVMSAHEAIDSADPEIHTLVQQIVGRVVNEHPPVTSPQETDDIKEVLLDIELDGARYMLLRMQPVEIRPRVTLSPREHEIARMVAKGYPNKTIAAVLEISSWTVCTHLRRIFAKLGVSSRAAMVARLLEDQPVHSELSPRHK